MARAKLLEAKKKDRETGKTSSGWVASATTNSVQCFEALVLEEVGEISTLLLPLSIAKLLSVLTAGKVGSLIKGNGQVSVSGAEAEHG